jgi:hypothetical protein
MRGGYLAQIVAPCTPARVFRLQTDTLTPEVRHVRILGLSLVAVFALGTVAATSALAEKPLSEAALAKLYKPFSACPFNETDAEGYKPEECIFASTAGGKEGGEYTVGSITIPLSKKIILQGGENEEEESNKGGEGGRGAWFEATNNETLVAPPLNVPGGLSNRIASQPYWPAGLKESFANAKKNHELTATESLQLAGKPWVNRANLLEEKRTAFYLPMKVVVNSPWLTTLGGGTCHIGSAEHPIVVELTSDESTGPFPYEYNTSHGAKGELKFSDSFNEVKIINSTLVDNKYAVETGAEGCGGAYESFVDHAISTAAGVPAPAGANSVILKGTLFNANTTRTACVLGVYTKNSKEECETKAKEEGLNL